MVTTWNEIVRGNLETLTHLRSQGGFTFIYLIDTPGLRLHHPASSRTFLSLARIKDKKRLCMLAVWGCIWFSIIFSDTLGTRGFSIFPTYGLLMTSKNETDWVYHACITRAFQLTCWMTLIYFCPKLATNYNIVKNYNRLESLLVKYTCVQMLN